MATIILLSGLLIMSAAVILFTLIWLVGGLIGIIYGAPFVPSSGRKVKAVMAMADIQPGEVVYELGSGDGRLVFAALEYTDNVFGIEVAWPQYWWSRLRQVIQHKGGILQRKNMFDVSLTQADVVICYLYPPIMKRLKMKFEEELPEGARVIAYAFPVPGWPIEKQKGHIYLQKKTS